MEESNEIVEEIRRENNQQKIKKKKRKVWRNKKGKIWRKMEKMEQIMNERIEKKTKGKKLDLLALASFSVIFAIGFKAIKHRYFVVFCESSISYINACSQVGKNWERNL